MIIVVVVALFRLLLMMINPVGIASRLQLPEPSAASGHPTGRAGGRAAGLGTAA